MPTAKKKIAKPANPFTAAWRTPFGMPPFAKIEAGHFLPAFKTAMNDERAQVAAIASNEARPTFVNTIAALEKTGVALERVARVFFNLASADTTPELQAIQREISPRLAAHGTAIMLNPKLFKRIDELYARRDKLKLDDESRRLLELRHLWHVQAGAKLKPKAKKRVAEINERLAVLSTNFMQNVLADEQSWHMVLKTERDRAGLPASLVDSALRAGADRGLNGKHAITLSRSSVEPFLTYSSRRDLREKAWKAWTRRGENGGKTDNRAIIAEVVALRSELARLLGYDSYAESSLVDTMAGHPDAVRDLLHAVWPRAKARAAEERDALAARAKAEGANVKIAPWDWRYYAEKERKARFDLDEAKLRPYLSLDAMIEAAFDTARRLFGLRFTPLPDAPRYHPDVRVWEVTNARGEHIGIFMGDYFARASKQSGAWMSSFRDQHGLGKGQRPIIVNVLNVARGGEGEPTLLSFDDARTLFHEFGHGLHGLLSDVTYPSLSGTSVSRDFVELPSQLYEHWLSRPEVLKTFALHYKIRKPMPATLLKRLSAARNFDQGFATVEYTACAILDLELHASEDGDEIDIDSFEAEQLKRIGMPKEIVMRHRLPHFMHIMGGYAAGYYSYLWSEVMDADAFAAFEDAGDIFHKPTARKLKKHIYSAGNRRDPKLAYKAFRGRPPDIEALLKKRGFLNER